MEYERTYCPYLAATNTPKYERAADLEEIRMMYPMAAFWQLVTASFGTGNVHTYDKETPDRIGKGGL